MSEKTMETIIVALLGAGGATFVWTLVKSYLAIRASAEGREDKAVNRLERFEEDCRQQLTFERKWGAYWSRRASALERVILVHLGSDHLPMPEPEPESIPSD